MRRFPRPSFVGAMARARSCLSGPVIPVLLLATLALPAAAWRAEGTETDSIDSADSVHAIYAHFEIDRGCFVVLERATRKWSAFGSACDGAYLPASTFKVANALIGLESGVIEGADFTLPWDGVEHEFVDAWNRDHDLDSAMQHSVLWYFQAVARRLGEDTYRTWLRRFDYGNRDPGGGLDRFWVAGDLRITPRQQVAFLDRLVGGELAVSQRARDILRQVMPDSQGQVGDARIVVRAKTGLTNQAADRVGWLVGWVEREDDERAEPTHVFASLVLGSADQTWRESPTFRARAELPMAILAHLGIIPKGLGTPW